MQKILKIALLPLSVLYALVLYIRHTLYDLAVFKSYKSSIRTVGIGNLAFGGSGKSPLTIYLAEFLMSRSLKVAIVSRGYKRSTQGVLRCNAEHKAKEIGDEPKMYVSKLPHAIVMVAERRKEAILFLEGLPNPPDVILLDDCYQHRAITPHVLLLLSEAQKPYWKDWLVPSGYLRDVKYASKRADALILTKLEPGLTISLPHFWKAKNVFESSITYLNPLNKGKKGQDVLDSVVCFSGLADDKKLKEYLSSSFNLVQAFSFPDHHYFTDNELKKIIKKAGTSCSILTTEKDYARLTEAQLKILSEENFHVVPISTPPKDEKKFQAFILTSLGLK
ncbi:MAG: tetraacyldisaccharide 4'-kinase [Flavobacteriales bacterium]